MYMDATARWPFAGASASHVYADNVIEHIRMSGNRALFREAYRVLAVDGRIRLVTPDVERLVALYSRRDEEARWHLENARHHGYEAHHLVDLLRIVFQDAGHYLGYLWDFEALSSELHAAGFVEITRYEEGVSDDPVLTGLELRRDVRTRSPIALVVEARKP
jgi:predicted SAM-dependent methyltransferase